MEKGHALSEHSESKGFAPIFILIGMIILAVVAGGGYYLGKSQAPKPQMQNQIVSQTPQPTTVPLSTPVISPEPASSAETANWKTYINSKQAFSIKYPGEFDLREGIDWDTGTLFFSDNIRLRNITNSVFDCKIYCPDFSSVEDITINSISVKKAEGIKNLTSGNIITDKKGPYFIYQFPKGGTYYLLEYGPMIGSQSSNQEKIFHLMAKTFKFISSTPMPLINDCFKLCPDGKTVECGDQCSK